MPTPARPVGRSQTPDGMWFRCNSCGEILYRKTLESNFFICARCGYHFRITPDKYIQICSTMVGSRSWMPISPRPTRLASPNTQSN